MNFSDYQKINPPIIAPPAGPAYLPPVKRRWGRRLGIIFTLAAVIAVIVFLLLLFWEVARRDAELKNLLASAREGTSASIIENKLLGELADKTAGLTPTSTTSNIGAVPANTDARSPERQLAEKSGRPTLGNASSSLVIVEFGDFECPICLQEFPIIRTITNKYAKDILFIYRQYPIKTDNSAVLAQASLCAAEQGKFWPLHDRLYANQGKLTNTDDLKNLVIMSGVNWNKLETCVNSQKYSKQILEDMSDALDLGVKGTPTFFVNGTKLEGAITADVWEQIISKSKELSK